MKWTAEVIQTLNELLPQGKSASDIAAVLTQAFGEPVTRNMVKGKVHRLHGNGALSSPKAKTEPKPKPKTARKEIKAMAKVVATPVAVDAGEGRNLTLTQLTRSSCRWPSGDPVDDTLRFCGEYAVPGRSYCPHHFLLAYRPALPSIRLPAKVR